MSYASPTQYYQPKNQMVTFAAVMFGAIVAAITASTMIIMSLMNGQIANALSNNVSQSGATVAAPGTCLAPTETSASKSDDNGSATTAASWGTVNRSFNTHNKTIISNVKIHREVHIKHIRRDHNTKVVIKDNTLVLGAGNTVVTGDDNNVGNTDNSVDSTVVTTVVTNVDNSVTNTDSFNSGISDNEIKL